ncbi:unnamed protein product [Adineta steineri]|uniref:Uncharacterized protein n=1 Tax=Adineta steineri TaxID=433720 RepID=A0A819EXR1_9BILA|nr:unnamed protein product [Adineta steineri]CAF3858287.1 unnamed protein product [Adineta steineri]
MANFPSFDEYYLPRLQSRLNENVGRMEQVVNRAKEMDADAAERLLNEACGQLLSSVTHEVNEIKTSIKQIGETCTSPEDRQRYVLFVRGAATGIQSSQTLFGTIFLHINNLVTTVVDWIRRGVSWVVNVVKDTFAAIRSFFSN